MNEDIQDYFGQIQVLLSEAKSDEQRIQIIKSKFTDYDSSIQCINYLAGSRSIVSEISYRRGYQQAIFYLLELLNLTGEKASEGLKFERAVTDWRFYSHKGRINPPTWYQAQSLHVEDESEEDFYAD